MDALRPFTEEVNVVNIAHPVATGARRVKCLVVGGNGFLGSHLVEALAADGHTVTAFDRYGSSGPVFDESIARIVRADFLDRDAVAAAVAGQDYVFHFLSTTTPATADNDPATDLRTNVEPTVELLQACVAAGVSRVYYASTGGAIYGNQPKGDYAEVARTLPQSPYGIGKLTIEQYLGYFRVKSGLDYLALRISNPYGPRQRIGKPQGLIPIALRALDAGTPITRFGDGSMIRDYIYVTDAVDMISAIVRADTHKHHIYNIGSGQGHSVTEVLDTLVEVTGRSAEIIEMPVPPTFVDHVVLDTARFSLEFGAPNLVTLREGIVRTWATVTTQPTG
ncbi:MAG: UDP-glucose 4-epimerase [Glaciihabitans sp.]|jgi:UDP-glucose 4-epimerase|nr:UDP-glucose 4-epimerase [Glaciihabitans sp.]